MEFNTITVLPHDGQSPQGLVVLMHGWGANAKDLATLAPILNLPAYQFIFPDAPFPHSQVPEGRAWYALETMEHEGLLESRQGLQSWLTTLEDHTGIPLSRTILGGFSQGGAMTLDVGRTLPFAGLMSLSGYLHFSPEPQESCSSPILIVHGRQDRVVPLRLAWQARDYFQQLGTVVQYHELEMGHEIPPNVWQLMRSFYDRNPVESRLKLYYRNGESCRCNRFYSGVVLSNPHQSPRLRGREALNYLLLT